MSYLRQSWSVNLRVIENCILSVCSIERNIRPILRTNIMLILQNFLVKVTTNIGALSSSEHVQYFIFDDNLDGAVSMYRGVSRTCVIFHATFTSVLQLQLFGPYRSNFLSRKSLISS